MTKTDAAVAISSDGKRHNTALHQAMVEGVDDHDFRMRDKAALIKAGVPKAVMDRLIP